ncbi:MAG: PA14 domain-containing protein, partial [Rubripirellula sp.]
MGVNTDDEFYGTASLIGDGPAGEFIAFKKSVDKMPDLDKLKADKTGVSRGLDIGVGGRNENVIISYEGFLPISRSGKYSFRLSSDDGSMLYLDGKKLIDNDGVHPNTAKEASINLQAGMHAIRVNWFEKGGEEVLALDWAGPGVKSGGIDKAIVMTADGTPPPVEEETEEVDPNKFVYDPTLVNRGRELFTSLGCAGCHVKTEAGKPVQSLVKAPSLTDCEAGKGCLAEAAVATVPNYELTSIQQAAVEAAMRSGAGDEKEIDTILSHSMAALNCYACHQRDGKGGPESDRNPLFVSTIPEMGDEGRLPPPLDGAGDKLREDWLTRVIGNGDKSRPYMKTYMPNFGEGNAKSLAGHLATLDKVTAAKLVDSGETETRKASFGRQMVGSKGLACVSCHTYGKFKSTGIQAIALDTMTQRIREDWFHRYLPDPQKYRPGTRMPTGYPEGKSTVTNVYGGDRDLQLAAMWAFLKKGANGGVPEGIVNGMIELKADNKPVIYRNFIEGVTPRGIAVGYPERANLCWDANRMALAVVWQDRFIDASKHWEGRGQGNQTPLGGNVTMFEKVTPVAVLEDLDAAWPD